MTEFTILVTGGTGTLGRLVVARLRDAGANVRVLSRNPGEASDGLEFVRGDLATGAGVEDAVRGISTIIHCAGSQKGDDDKARALVRAVRQEGIRHLVHISVVGADKIPVSRGVDRAMFGYFDFKRKAEEIVRESGVPYSILRATQFHDLNLTAVRALAKLPVIPSPGGFRFQPISADEVAERLVELAFGRPSGLVPDIGGPRIYAMTELIRGYLARTGKRRPIVQMRMPGRAAAAFRAGANLTPEHAVGTQSWEDFLTERVEGVRV
ncbi:SDR family oxidoreductase [Mycetocola zhadangensis]|uniref:NAD-dependent epimerase/dehydratase family protein n=1 Tax=Mycetocola zhadangensis TaxID=1164595 RepID=A0A3L7J7G1_9MICO|nr:NAD(P)H-binding protein [Mycetocola zhadangensis]RLQ84442.1 NAD-dependent epimerase/dehydratase family protein [Mycetocola zhadangensis]GGE92966.1 NmrA family transcriptional regulator [Mycetocola zhadangensis]